MTEIGLPCIEIGNARYRIDSVKMVQCVLTIRKWAMQGFFYNMLLWLLEEKMSILWVLRKEQYVSNESEGNVSKGIEAVRHKSYIQDFVAQLTTWSPNLFAQFTHTLTLPCFKLYWKSFGTTANQFPKTYTGVLVSSFWKFCCTSVRQTLPGSVPNESTRGTLHAHTSTSFKGFAVRLVSLLYTHSRIEPVWEDVSLWGLFKFRICLNLTFTSQSKATKGVV